MARRCGLSCRQVFGLGASAGFSVRRRGNLQDREMISQPAQAIAIRCSVAHLESINDFVRIGKWLRAVGAGEALSPSVKGPGRPMIYSIRQSACVLTSRDYPNAQTISANERNVPVKVTRSRRITPLLFRCEARIAPRNPSRKSPAAEGAARGASFGRWQRCVRSRAHRTTSLARNNPRFGCVLH